MIYMKFSDLTLKAFPLLLSISIESMNISRSKLEGLNRRFPEAWLNRSKYVYFNHPILNDLDLETEFFRKLTYCLCEYLQENDALKKAVIEMIYLSKKKEINSFIKIKQEELKVDRNQCLTLSFGQLLEILKINPQNLEVICFIASSNLILEEKGFLIEEEEGLQLKELWNHAIEELLCDSWTHPKEAKNLLPQITRDLKNNRSKLYKKAMNIYSAYSKHLNEPVASHLAQLLRKKELRFKSETDLFSFLAIDQFSLIEQQRNQVTVYDVLEGMTYLLCLKELKEHLITVEKAELKSQKLHETLMELQPNYSLNNLQLEELFIDHLKKRFGSERMYQLIDFVPESLFDVYDEEIEALFDQYLVLIIQLNWISKVVEANRNFFYTLYNTNDNSSIKKIEQDLSRQQEKIKQLEHDKRTLKKELNQTKIDYQTRLSKQLKDSNIALIKAEQENRKLKEEIEALRKQISTQPSEYSTNSPSLEKESPSLPLLTLVSKEEKIKSLNRADYVIVGGHPNVVLKLKELLPNCKFYECEEMYKKNSLNGVTRAFINKIWVNHGMTEKIRKVCRNIPVCEVDATNPDRLLDQMYSHLLKEVFGINLLELKAN